MSEGSGPPEFVEHLTDLQDRDHVVTIGTFDGVHRGHQFLLDQVTARARQLQVPALIVTFEPVPAQVLRPEHFAGRLSSAATKLDLLAACHADAIAVLAFTRSLSQLGAEEFMSSLVAHARPREVWVGEAFALGRNRMGDVERLRTIGHDLGYRLYAVPRLEDDGLVISSSAIRQMILNGQPEQAARGLGRYFRMEGEVVHGAHVGRTIGFPTANVVPPADIVRLPDGIYATLAVLPGRERSLPAMTYIGTRPALNTGARLIETHILDFDEDIYGQWIGVDFVAHLRGDATFPSLDELIAQLRADEVAARMTFSRLSSAETEALTPARASAGLR
ncbi:MAG: riboflavin biosynthesis protein RibF [Chloroflexota bacterium]|nr:riboflavin biosynthesis protein RibF [Chloroflexota bacterium]